MSSLSNSIDDPDREHEMDRLRQSKQANVLRVAAADVSRRMPLMVVSDHLTEIAEAVLRAASASRGATSPPVTGGRRRCREAARSLPNLDFTDNIRLLEGFGRAGLMPDEDVVLLADAYRAYRGRIHELSLQESEGVVDDEEFAGLREAVIAVWNRLMGP